MHHEFHHLKPEDRKLALQTKIAEGSGLPLEVIQEAFALEPEPDAPLADDMTYKQRKAHVESLKKSNG